MPEKPAGWVTCAKCKGDGYFFGLCGRAMQECMACDGLGIVVGPPEDGISFVAYFQMPHMQMPAVFDYLVGCTNEHGRESRA